MMGVPEFFCPTGRGTETAQTSSTCGHGALRMFDEKKPEGAVCRRPHNPRSMKRFPWPVCRFCGLVYLKNERTKKAIRKGCWKWADER